MGIGSNRQEAFDTDLVEFTVIGGLIKIVHLTTGACSQKWLYPPTGLTD